jgi:hypothetical protein
MRFRTRRPNARNNPKNNRSPVVIDQASGVMYDVSKNGKLFTTYLAAANANALGDVVGLVQSDENIDVINLILWSEDISKSAWTKIATATVTGTNIANFPANGDYLYQAATGVFPIGTVITGVFLVSGTGTTQLRVSAQGGVYEQNTQVVTLTATPTLYIVSRTIANASQTTIALNPGRVAGETATSVTFHYMQLNFGSKSYQKTLGSLGGEGSLYQATSANRALVGCVPFGLGIRNRIRNSAFTGTVAGSPGTLPTNITGTGTGGVFTRTLAAPGYTNGINVLSIRFQASGAGDAFIVWESKTYMSALAAQAFAQRLYARLASGTLTNLTLNIRLEEYDAAGVYIISTDTNIVPTAGPLTTQLFTNTRNLTDALTRYVGIAFQFSFSGAGDATLEFGIPSLESGLVVTNNSQITNGAHIVQEYLERVNLLSYTSNMLTGSGWFPGIGSFFSVTTSPIITPIGDYSAIKFTNIVDNIQLFCRIVNTLSATTYSGGIYIYVEKQPWMANFSFQLDFQDVEISAPSSLSTSFNQWVRIAVENTTIAASRTFIDFNLLFNNNAVLPKLGTVFHICMPQVNYGSTLLPYQEILTTWNNSWTRVPSIPMLWFDESNDWYTNGANTIQGINLFCTSTNKFCLAVAWVNQSITANDVIISQSVTNTTADLTFVMFINTSDANLFMNIRGTQTDTNIVIVKGALNVTMFNWDGVSATLMHNNLTPVTISVGTAVLQDAHIGIGARSVSTAAVDLFGGFINPEYIKSVGLTITEMKQEMARLMSKYGI